MLVLHGSVGLPQIFACVVARRRWAVALTKNLPNTAATRRAMNATSDGFDRIMNICSGLKFPLTSDHRPLTSVSMAERVGFEPTERFPVHSISSAANSTTLAPLPGRISDCEFRIAEVKS